MNKKVLNISLVIIVILIVVIFTALFLVYNNRASNSIYQDLEVSNKTNLIPEMPEQNLVSNQEATVQEESDENKIANASAETIDTSPVYIEYDPKKLEPFTGAFPSVDIIPFIMEKGDITSFSNEQILRLGFSKVTKDDWYESYTGEGEPLSIPASLLDGYIKNIFGQNVKYQKSNFSNTNYSIDKDFKSHTSSYNVTYVAENDTYTIEHIAGDGIDENYIQLMQPMISKVKGDVEIEIPYVFVVYGDEMVEGTYSDGTVAQGFEYIVYANCNYASKTFSEELGRFTEFDDHLLNEDGVFSMYDVVKDFAQKDMSKLQKMTLIYGTNEENTEYVLKEIKK